MNVKVIMSWDIIPGREQEYFEFVVRSFMPGVQKLGMALSDAWVTIYGEHPQILVGAVVPGLEKAENIISSEEWQRRDRRCGELGTIQPIIGRQRGECLEWIIPWRV